MMTSRENDLYCTGRPVSGIMRLASPVNELAEIMTSLVLSRSRNNFTRSQVYFVIFLW